MKYPPLPTFNYGWDTLISLSRSGFPGRIGLAIREQSGSGRGTALPAPNPIPSGNIRLGRRQVPTGRMRSCHRDPPCRQLELPPRSHTACATSLVHRDMFGRAFATLPALPPFVQASRDNEQSGSSPAPCGHLPRKRAVRLQGLIRTGQIQFVALRFQKSWPAPRREGVRIAPVG
jgi:hypothetical protein